MSKKPVDDRRRKLDELKRKQHASEKRGTIVAIVVALLAGGALITGAVMTSRNDPAAPKADLAEIGVAKADAACGDVVPEDEKKVRAQHVAGQVQYPNPPSSGDHNGTPAPGNIRFYARDTDRAPEQIVHNLEHGYTVVWYDDDLPQEEVDMLQSVARSIADDNRKFIVFPWIRGKFEGDKNIGIASWARMQLCGKVSGEVIEAFSDEYGFKGDKNVAPEKNAP